MTALLFVSAIPFKPQTGLSTPPLPDGEEESKAGLSGGSESSVGDLAILFFFFC